MILERHRYKKINDEWIVFETHNLDYQTYEYTEENVKLVSGLIVEKLDPKYLSRIYKEENKTNPLFGHCYHSTQALYYFLNCDILTPYSGKDSLGNTHWWLQDGETIIDVTAAQYDKIDCDPPYEVGKPSKWYGWKNRPHKRTLKLMNEVQPTSRLYATSPKDSRSI
jgi:hypothetical protein